MRYEKMTIDHNETHFYQFDGMEDVTEHVLPVAAKQTGISYSEDPASVADWIGRKFANHAEAFEAVNQEWPEGMATFDEMMDELRDAQLPRPKSIRRKSTWSEDIGDEVDVDRLRRGDPYWRTTKRDARPGPVSVTIVINLSTSASVDYEKMIWRGAAAICLASLLEQAGYRVELQCAIRSISAYKDCSDVFVTTCLKRGPDPLDVSVLVNMVSSWWLRIIFFAICNLAPVAVSSGHGAPKSLVGKLNLITPDEQAILSENIWNKQAAIQWVRDEIGKLESKHEVQVCS